MSKMSVPVGRTGVYFNVGNLILYVTSGGLGWLLLESMGAWYANVSIGGGVAIALLTIVFARRLPGWLLGALITLAALVVAYVAAGCPALNIVWG